MNKQQSFSQKETMKLKKQFDLMKVNKKREKKRVENFNADDFLESEYFDFTEQFDPELKLLLTKGAL